jgi:hypothetical protein
MAASAFCIAGENAINGPAARRNSADDGLCAATRRSVSTTMRTACAHHFVHPARGFEAGIARVDLAQDAAHDVDLGDVVEREQIGAQAVVDVVRVIGDVVGQGRDLRLGARLRPQIEILDLVVGENRRRHAMLGIAGGGLAGAVGERAVVLDQPFERLPRQVEAVEGGIAALQIGDDAQAVRIVVETADAAQSLLQRALAGMAEGRVAEIVRQRQRLGEVLVEPERAGERAGDLGDLQRMGQPRAVMIALVKHEDLRLVRQAPESGRMDDAVAIAAEGVAGRARPFRPQPAPAMARIGGKNSPFNGRFDRHGSLGERIDLSARRT